MATWVELPLGTDVLQDRAGNLQSGASVSVTVGDTATDATHAKRDGTTATTGGLIVRSDGTIGSATERRYFLSDAELKVTIAGRFRYVNPVSALDAALLALVESDVTAWKAAKELNIRDSSLFSGLYPNGGGATDSTAGLNAAIDYASQEALARGQDKIKLWGFDGATLQIGQILAKSNVEIEGDGLTLMARADVASSGGLLRNLDTLAALIAASPGGTATTVSGSYELTSIDPTLLFPECKISGTGIQADTKIVAVDQSTNKALMSKTASASNSGVAITRAATHYGRCDNFTARDLILDPNGFNVGDPVRLLFTRHTLLERVTVYHNQDTTDTESWATHLGGRDLKVLAPTVIGGSEVTEDGIHISHGQNITVDDYYIEAGDDAIACGAVSVAADLSFARDPDVLRNVSIGAGTVRSMRGFAFRVFAAPDGATSQEVTDIALNGMTGSAGIYRNGGILIEDTNNTAAGLSKARRIGVHNCKLAVGGPTHDGTNPYALSIESADGVTIEDVAFTVTVPAAGGWTIYNVVKSDDVALNCREEITALGSYVLTNFSENGALDVR